MVLQRDIGRPGSLWKTLLLSSFVVFTSVDSWAQEEGASPESTRVGERDSRATAEEKPASEWGEDFQIRVSGENPSARVMFSSYTRDLREDFRRLIFTFRADRPYRREPWRVPIWIELWGNPDDVYRGDSVRVSPQIRPGDKMMILMQVRLHDQFQEEEFRLETVRALILEQMLGGAVDNPSLVEGRPIKVPPWLTHGFDQLIVHRRAGSPSAFYEGFFASGQMLNPEEIFAVENPENLDPLSYDLFRASSAAFVKTLLEQEPEGDASMRSLLHDLGMLENPQLNVLLRQYFPEFREMDQGIEKWWALQLAMLGQQQRTEYLSRAETERLLDEALVFRILPSQENEVIFTEKKKEGFLRKIFQKTEEEQVKQEFTGTLFDYSKYIGLPGAEDELIQVFGRLQRLKQVGAPLYRPLITVYEEIVEKIGRRDLKEIESLITSAQEMREKINATMKQTEDYLNYYEATSAPSRSGEFDDYQKLRRQLESKPPPPRNDRIWRYMNYLEGEFR